MVVDTGQGITCFDSCLLKVTWTSNIKDVLVVMVLASFFLRYLAWRMDVHTSADSH